MNNATEPFAATEHAVGNTAARDADSIFANMFLPASLYELLPAIYITAGSLLMFGALYIGIGHGPMVGYFALGLSSLLAGISVSTIRRRARAVRNR